MAARAYARQDIMFHLFRSPHSDIQTERNGAKQKMILNRQGSSSSHEIGVHLAYKR